MLEMKHVGCTLIKMNWHGKGKNSGEIWYREAKSEKEAPGESVKSFQMPLLEI